MKKVRAETTRDSAISVACERRALPCSLWLPCRTRWRSAKKAARVRSLPNTVQGFRGRITNMARDEAMAREL
ncbi:MAG: hypothetical protein LC754_12965 [Acidobacteria bacterium]|nr:hypothetical protein [Acidobacteriota bacterium]